MSIVSAFEDVAPLWPQGLAFRWQRPRDARLVPRWLWLFITGPWCPCLFRVNFSHLAKRLLKVFQEECVQKYQASLVAHGKRMR